MTLNLDRSAWKRVRFGDVADRSRTQADRTSGTVEKYVAGGHFDEGAMEVRRWGVPDDGAMGSTFTYVFHPGQVLYVSASWYLRKAGVATFEGVVADKTYVIESRDPELLDPRFLPWVMVSDRLYDYAAARSTGSMNARLLWKALANFEFDLPPLDEQKRITDLLWAIERHRLAILDARQRSDALADEVFGTALATTTAPNVLLPELMNEMTVGVVVRPTQYYTDDPAGVPALRGLNIEPGGFDLTDLVRFKPESAAELKKSTLRAGDVAIVRTGRPGDAAVVTEEVSGFNCIDLIIARPGSELEPQFLAHFLNSTYGRRQIARLSAGTAQLHFNVGALKKLEIPRLSDVEQRMLVGRVEQVRDTSEVLREEADRLRELATAVLAQVFGGD